MTELALKTTDRRAVQDLSAVPPAPKEAGATEAFLAALRHGATVEQAEQIGEMLLRFRDKEEARIAEQAFNAAFAKAMTAMPAVPKDAKAQRGQAGTFQYSKLETILGKAQPVLGRHGLHLGFGVDRTDDGKSVGVTAIVRHEGGHSIRESLSSPIVSFASANTPLQNLEGTVTALKRTLSMSILGLAVGGEEEEAPYVGHSEPISEAQRDELIALANDVGADVEKFCAFLKVEAIADLPTTRFNEAKRALEAKRRQAQ